MGGSSVQFAVNVAGPFRDEAGIGAHGRHIVEIIRAAGYPCRITLCDSSPHRKAASIRESDNTDLPLAVNVVAVNIDYLPYFLDEAPDFLKDRYTIAYWIWETEPLPATWAARGNLVDEVWAGSRYSALIFARSLQQPVLAVPYGVMPAEPVPVSVSRADLMLPSGFLFLFCFDALSFERKNPWGLIEAEDTINLGVSVTRLWLNTPRLGRKPVTGGDRMSWRYRRGASDSHCRGPINDGVLVRWIRWRGSGQGSTLTSPLCPYDWWVSRHARIFLADELVPGGSLLSRYLVAIPTIGAFNG